MSKSAPRPAAAAVERVAALLRPEYLEQPRPARRDGYLDVVERDLDQQGVARELMQTTALTTVYENWWRPALGRLAKGVFGPGMADERRIARLLLGLGPGDGVLDVACGPGNFSRDFARAVGATGLVVGIDSSRPMLARAVKDTSAAGISNLAFVYGDATVLPFRDASFDAVCCFAALYLIAEPFKALDQMTRVLTPGGRIAILASCRSRTPGLAALESALTARSGLRMFGQEEIVEALRERGFAEVRQRISGLAQFVGGRLG